MSDEKDNKMKATRRLSTEEVNKRARRKRLKTSSDETQVVGKVKAQKGKEKNSKPKKKKFKERHPRIATIIKIFIILIVLVLIILAGIFAGAIWGGYNFFDLLGDDYKISMEDLVVSYENSVVYDINNNVIGTLSAGTKRKSVKMSEMSEYLPKAFVAIEDERFYKHTGVDFKRTAAATFTYIIHGGKSSFGGSTITQQVVKNITGDKKDNALRKIKEMVKAIQVEHYLSKDQILELYLNLIFIGGKDVNGVALGAVYYFNKDVKDLTLAECAYMAAINHTPNSYNPFKEDENKEKRIKSGEDRTKTVLKKMKELGSINQKEYDEAIAEVDAGLPFSNGDTNTTSIVSYHTSAAIDQILDQMVAEKGISRDLAEIQLYSGGYHIYTTQDTPLQAEVENQLQVSHVFTSKNEKEADRNGQKSMAAMTIVDPKTGNVVATSAVKGSDEERTTQTYLGFFNNATEIKKQTGSSIKPLAVLAPGLETGKLTAATTFFDGYTVFPGGYDPKNEGAFSNTNMSLRRAIALSQNIPHVKAMSVLGVNNSVEFLNKIGLKEIKGDENLSLALGGLTTGVSPMQMAAAYAMVANDGVYIEPTFYTKVVDKDGNTYLEPKPVADRSTRVMSSSNAYIVKNLMRNVVTSSEGTATYCAIPNMDVAAKTGTTNEKHDRWLCGFTNYYAAACWVGFEKGAHVYAEGMRNPAGTIWSNVMKNVHKGLESSRFATPDNIVTAQICSDTGLAASSKCTNTYAEQFVKGTVPPECDRHSPIKICNETGLLASEFCLNYSERTFGIMSPQEESGNWKTTYKGGNFDIPSEVCPHKASDYAYPD